MPIGWRLGGKSYLDVVKGQYLRNSDYLSNKYIFDLSFDESVRKGHPISWTPYVAGGRPLIGDGVSSILDPIHWVFFFLMSKNNFLGRLEAEKLGYFFIGVLLILLFSRWAGLTWQLGLFIVLIYFNSPYPLRGHGEYMWFLPTCVCAAFLYIWDRSRKLNLIKRLMILSLYLAFSWYVLLADFPLIIAIVLFCWLIAEFVLFNSEENISKKEYIIREFFLSLLVFGTAIALSLPKFLPLKLYLSETTRNNYFQFNDTIFSIPLILKEMKDFIPEFLFINFPAGSLIFSLGFFSSMKSILLKRIKLFSALSLIIGFFIHCGAFNKIFLLFKWNTKLMEFWPIMTMGLIGFYVCGLHVMIKPEKNRFILRLIPSLFLAGALIYLVKPYSYKSYFYIEIIIDIFIIIIYLIWSYKRSLGGHISKWKNSGLSYSQIVLSLILVTLTIISFSGAGLAKLFSWFPKNETFYHPLYCDQIAICKFNYPLSDQYRAHYLKPEIDDCGDNYRITSYIVDLKTFHNNGCLYPNHSFLWNYLDAGGVYSLFTKRYTELIVNINKGRWIDSNNIIIHSKEPSLIRNVSPLIRYLSLKYLISPKELNHPSIELSRSVSSPITYDYQINPVQKLDKVYIYKVLKPIPRFFFPNIAKKVPPQDIVLTMENLSKEDRPLVITSLENREETISCSSATFELEKNELDRLYFKINALGETYFVIHDVFMPGWKAWLNGNSVQILQANYAFMAIKIPRGRHKLLLRYIPPGFKEGIIITTSALFILIALYLLNKKKKHIKIQS